MKEKEAIKTFLEWMNTKKLDMSMMDGYLYNPLSNIPGKQLTFDEALSLYEQETKQYTVGEVWDAIIPSRSWHSRSGSHQKEYTAFAERYHELKTQNRIKQ